jgi:hypothetical protein
LLGEECKEDRKTRALGREVPAGPDGYQKIKDRPSGAPEGVSVRFAIEDNPSPTSW